MNRYNTPLTAIALAAAALLSACGGGGTTADTTPPTVTISDNMPGTATGDVTFTFTFNEAVTGFTTDDITVTNGTKGAFTMAANGLSATLVVAPPSTGSGNILVSVAAGTFTDIAKNANTAAASATQAFGAAVVNLISNGDFSNGVTGWTGNAANVVTENGNSYNFANVTAAGDPWAVNLSYVLNIPTSGVNYKLTFKASSNRTRALKAGIGLNVDPYTNTVQDLTLTTTPQTFVLNLTSNFANANSRIIFDMGHDTGHVVIDDVVLEIVPPVTPPPSTAVTFSSGFTSNVLTGSGGAIASAGGSNLDGWNCTGGEAWCGSGAGGSGADSFTYFYYQTPSAAEGLYSQIEVFGPNVTGFNVTGDTGGVTLGSQTKVNFTFNPNEEWFNTTAPKLGVVLTLGKRYAIGDGCRIQLQGVKPIASKDATAYSMNLAADFRVAQDCGTGIAPDNVAGALAASSVVSSVKFVGAGGGAAITGRNDAKSTANLTNPKTDGVYPTTVALKGSITFD
ncbi:MAG: hypothetical protein RJB34_482 [Pseudomonadota bacterium]|jgi:hypothetical protein